LSARLGERQIMAKDAGPELDLERTADLAREDLHIIAE